MGVVINGTEFDEEWVECPDCGQEIELQQTLLDGRCPHTTCQTPVKELLRMVAKADGESTDSSAEESTEAQKVTAK